MRRPWNTLALAWLVIFASGNTLRADDPAIRPASLPGKLGLEGKWEQFLSRPITPDGVAAMLEEDLDGGQLVRWGDARYTSLWSAVQRRAAADKQLVTALRGIGEEGTRALLEEAESLTEVLAIARRYPWALSAHQALVEAGEKELRHGHVGLASSCFRDVLARSADADLRARAQVGLWVIAAHSSHGDAIETAFRGVDPDARFPWLGEQVRAADLRDRLRSRKPAPAATEELKALQRRILEVPGSFSWVSGQPAVSARGQVVGGPNLLAFYDGPEQAPRWKQVFPLAAGNDVWAPLVPGPFLPVVVQRHVYTRWGVQSVTRETTNPREGPTVGVLCDVAAFGARTGSLIWSTAGSPAWKDLGAISDPTHADGRIYVLAVLKAEQYSPVYLACLDADRGTLLWKRELVSNHTTFANIRPPSIAGRPSTRVGVADVARHGNAVTVVDGAVYCQTNVGVVACCDARDGLIEWVRSYPQDARTAIAQRRLGASPLVVGSRVVFLPRDTGGVLALDRDTGELNWFRTDETALRALGVTGGRVLVADSRRVAALDAQTGKVQWEKSFPDPIDDRAVLAGKFVIVGTRTKLCRLDAESGALIEEQDWGAGGPMTGLAIHGETLFGLSRGAEVKPPPLPDVLTVSDKSVRVVHRTSQPPRIDGSPAEWESLSPTTWSGTGEVKGRLILTHDNQNLYVGLNAVGAAGAGRLELTLTVNKKPLRWAVSLGADGRAVWEGLGSSVPSGASAAGQRQLVDQALTFELAIPLASILGEKAAAQPDLGRFGLELALRADAGSAPVARLGETLHLLRLTQEQEAAAVSLARAMPELDTSWQVLEQYGRARTLTSGDVADFYRDYIKQQAKSPEVGHAMLRLDQVLRKSLTTDPSNEVLQLAAQVGVPEPVRAWYQKVAAAYLSQWVYVDNTFKPQQVALELFDGKSWDHRIVAGASTPPVNPLAGGGTTKIEIINGVRRVYRNGILVEENGKPVGGAAKPGSKDRPIAMPPLGSWHELRIPLLWLDMHDRPIHGIGFKQLGGSSIYWDRTAVIADGKETILIEDDLTQGAAQGDWRWQTEPVKSGKKVHMTPHPQYRDEDVRHAAYFHKPISTHILTGPDAGLPPEKVLALLEEKLPLLQREPHAAALSDRADALLRSDAVRRKALRQAILQKAAPDDVTYWLERFLHQEYHSGSEQPVQAIEALAKEARVAEPVLTEFRKRSQRSFLRTWQVLGHFPHADAQNRNLAYPPELEGVALDREYDGIGGKVRWKLFESASDRIDLSKLPGQAKAGVAFAVCWVHTETKQQALLEVGAQDGIKVWLNPRSKSPPVIDEPILRLAVPAQSSVKVELAPGWNEVLVRIDGRSGGGAFLLELRDTDGSRPLEGVRVHAQPPK